MKQYRITILERVKKNRYKERFSYKIKTVDNYKTVCENIKLKLKNNDCFEVKEIF